MYQNFGVCFACTSWVESAGFAAQGSVWELAETCWFRVYTAAFGLRTLGLGRRFRGLLEFILQVVHVHVMSCHFIRFRLHAEGFIMGVVGIRELAICALARVHPSESCHGGAEN